MANTLLQVDVPWGQQKPPYGKKLRKEFWQRGTPSRWLLNEGAGATTFDCSGQGNNGTIKNGIVWVSTPYGLGVKNAAVANGGITTTCNIASTTQATIWMWLIVLAKTNSVNKRYWTSNGGLFICYDDSTHFVTSNNVGATLCTITGGTNFALNTPYMLALVVNGINETMYLNGIVDGTGTGTFAGVGSQTLIWNGQGGGAFPSPNCIMLQGGFLPNVALTAAQVRQLYAPYADIEPRRYVLPVVQAAAGASGLLLRRRREAALAA